MRRATPGGIPVFRAENVTIIDKPRTNFDGQLPAFDKLWYGAVSFEVAGDVWVLENFLNFGAEGQTYTAIQKSTGRRLAAKFCSDKISSEVELVQKMPPDLVAHPNLIKYEMIFREVKTHFSPAQHVIFMEQVPNGELFDFITSQEPSVKGKPVTEGTSRRFLQDVVQGMAECYRYGLTHRDLKPENLLIDEEGRIVIIDMGHAKAAERPAPGALLAPTTLERFTTDHAYGTPAFNAPEVARGKQYECEPSDVWSLGVIAFTLHAKLPAFRDGGGVGDFNDIAGNNERFWEKIQKSPYYREFPEELIAFINTLWRETPAERPRFNKLAAAIGGDEEALTEFPGLRWLAKPVNEVEEFAEELLLTRPAMSLRLGARACVDLTGQFATSSGDVWTLTQTGASGEAQRESLARSYSVSGSVVSIVGTPDGGDLDAGTTGAIIGPIGSLCITWTNGATWRQNQQVADPEN